MASVMNNCGDYAYNEIIDAEAKQYDKETKAVLINFNKAKATCKTKKIYILLAFSLVIITFMILQILLIN